MLPPIPHLEDYGLSGGNGFLPAEPPLEILPPFYAKWESIVRNLQPLLLSKRVRAAVEALPILSTSNLQSEAEWRRAYVVLVFMLHAYVWGGDRPAEVSILHNSPTVYRTKLIIYFHRESRHS